MQYWKRLTAQWWVRRDVTTLVTVLGGCCTKEVTSSEERIVSRDGKQEMTTHSVQLRSQDGTSIGVAEDNEVHVAVAQPHGAPVKNTLYGFKACIVKLLVPPEAKVAVAPSEFKLRANVVVPLAIFCLSKAQSPFRVRMELDCQERTAVSCVHNNGFYYNVGELTEVKNFDLDLDKVCVPGIHFTFRLEEALSFHGYHGIRAEEIQNFEEVLNLYN